MFLRILLCCALLFGTFGPNLSARSVRIPLARSAATAQYVWFPSEHRGGLIPAFLEGSPKDVMADERDIHFYLYTKYVKLKFCNAL